jgi:hypothetical protein
VAISSGCLSRFIVRDNGVVTAFVTTAKPVIPVLAIVENANVPLFQQEVLPVLTMGTQPIVNVRMADIIP